ncbi:hypothetical protein M0804_007292 [Polistes exclamans]|nr:hypothetical protein M0804_007292 [Polistes exclamans]
MICALGFLGVAIVQILGEYQNKSNVVSLILPIVYVFFCLVWNFIFCYIGQHLQNVSEAVFRKAYETPWYILPRNSKKLLLFVITRAEKSSYVGIGKIFNASFEFLTALVRLSTSYAMVLHSLR